MISDDHDAKVWASSIGSTTIDIVDKRSPKQPKQPLRAAFNSKNLDALRNLQAVLESRK